MSLAVSVMVGPAVIVNDVDYPLREQSLRPLGSLAGLVALAPDVFLNLGIHPLKHQPGAAHVLTIYVLPAHQSSSKHSPQILTHAPPPPPPQTGRAGPSESSASRNCRNIPDLRRDQEIG